MSCSECNLEHPWYATACGAPVEYSAADRELQALLQGPERDQILSWMLDQALEVYSRPRSGGPRENVSQWLESLEVVPRGSVEITKSYYSWCKANNQAPADPRDLAEVFEETTGYSVADSLMS